MLHMMWSYQLLIKPISQSSIVITNTISWKPPLFGVWKVKNVSGSDRVTWDSKCIPQIPQVGDGGCWYRLACILSFQYRILKISPLLLLLCNKSIPGSLSTHACHQVSQRKEVSSTWFGSHQQSAVTAQR